MSQTFSLLQRYFADIEASMVHESNVKKMKILDIITRISELNEAYQDWNWSPFIADDHMKKTKMDEICRMPGAYMKATIESLIEYKRLLSVGEARTLNGICKILKGESI